MFVLVFGVPFAGLGGFFVYMGMSTMHEQVQLHDVAITVPATILSSDVRRSTTKTEPGTGSTTSSYLADIEFIYEYEGKTRTSDKVWPVEESGSAAAMRAVVERYPEGSQVSVFVDPDDPAVAFLEKRWSQMPYVAVTIGCLPVVFMTALGVLVVGWRRPGIAMLSAMVVGTLAIFLTGMASEHYLRHMPPSERAWWMWLVFGGCGALALGPLAVVIKARQLNHLYVKAVEAAQSS
jgi:multisubunit Na+/H+ antiporter MnhB subunit